MIRTLWRILIAGPPPEPEPVDRSPWGPGERVFCLDCESTYEARRHTCPWCTSGAAVAADVVGVW